MAQYLVEVTSTMEDLVWVDAESPEEALAIVNASSFNYSEALRYEHDHEPSLVGRTATLDEE